MNDKAYLIFAFSKDGNTLKTKKKDTLTERKLKAEQYVYAFFNLALQQNSPFVTSLYVHLHFNGERGKHKWDGN